MIPLRIIVQPREKENIVFLNSLPLNVLWPLNAPYTYARREEKKTNEKFFPRTILTLLTPWIFIWNFSEYPSPPLHPSSWDRLKIFLNAISFTILYFNSYFAPQFRVNILYATGIDANESTSIHNFRPWCDTFMQDFAMHASTAFFPLLLTVNFSKNGFAHLCESSFFLNIVKHLLTKKRKRRKMKGAAFL